jgi:hypothetical protein
MTKNGEDYYEDHEEGCDKNLKEHHGKDYDGKFASQAIGQEQDSEQNSQVVSGDDKEDSGNNFSFQIKKTEAITQQHNNNLLFF